MNGVKVGVIIIAITLVVVFLFGLSSTGYFVFNEDKSVRIGIVTDLSASAASWGESTVAGALVAKDELTLEGINLSLFVEDHKMSANEAVTATQKLINVDDIGAIYSEFTPVSIAISSVLKDKNIVHLYISAPVSILSENYNIKSFTDYQVDCRKVAEDFKLKGIKNMGVLTATSEFGELCLKGVLQVYPNSFVEKYAGLGVEKDLRVQVTKLKQNNVEAIINPGIEADLLNMLKVVNEFGWDVKIGGSSEGLSNKVISDYNELLKGSVYFSYDELPSEFKEKIIAKLGKEPQTYDAAAFAYLHIKQIARAISVCPNKDYLCVKENILSQKEDFFGFNGYNGSIAEFDIELFEIK